MINDCKNQSDNRQGVPHEISKAAKAPQRAALCPAAVPEKTERSESYCGRKKSDNQHGKNHSADLLVFAGRGFDTGLIDDYEFLAVSDGSGTHAS